MAGDRAAVSSVLRRNSARARASAVITDCLGSFRETDHRSRKIFALRLRQGCDGLEWWTQFGADMNSVGRCDARSEHPCRKRKQNCLCELPEGTSHGHVNINGRGPTSCQSTESKVPSVPAIVEHCQNLVDLVPTLLLRSAVERMGEGKHSGGLKPLIKPPLELGAKRVTLGPLAMVCAPRKRSHRLRSVGRSFHP